MTKRLELESFITDFMVLQIEEFKRDRLTHSFDIQQ